MEYPPQCHVDPLVQALRYPGGKKKEEKENKEQEVVSASKRQGATICSLYADLLFIASTQLPVCRFIVVAHIASKFLLRLDNWLTPLFEEDSVFYGYLVRIADAV